VSSREGESLQLSVQAYEILKGGILSLQRLPGAPLVERTLAEELSMSVTPVREALQRLEMEGLVCRLPYRGSTVSTISIDDVEEIYELRELLEARCVRVSATALGDKDLREMERELAEAERYSTSGDRAACGEAVWAAHNIFMRPVRNERLLEMLRNIRAQARRIGAVTTYIPGRQEKSLQEHAELLAALRSRDPHSAEQCMVRHIRSLRDDLRADYDHGGLSTAFLVSRRAASVLPKTRAVPEPAQYAL